MNAVVAHVDTSSLGTRPIPASPYYRPEFFELEREAIFRRVWLQVGHVSELAQPGSFIVRPIDVANASILITRAHDGKLRAFHNVCTHRGTQLVFEPSGQRTSFSCRYHMWTFGNDGKLRAAPDFERFYVDKEQCALPQVSVDVCGGLIFVNLQRSPEQSLREFLGPIAQRLDAFPAAQATTFAEYVYEIEANWKITYDNFQENYHLRFIHPRSGEAAAGPENPFGYPVKYGFYGPHRTQTIWSNPHAAPKDVQKIAFGKAMSFAMVDGSWQAEQAKDYLAIFPNFFIFGSPMSPFSHCVMPISATRSRGIIRLYWRGEDDSASKRFAREYAMCTAFDIHAEDRAVIEAGQRGLSSGALEYIHFQEQEVLCRHLIETVQRYIDEYQSQAAARAAR